MAIRMERYNVLPSETRWGGKHTLSDALSPAVVAICVFANLNP